MTSDPTRHPAGTNAGGRFAPGARAEGETKIVPPKVIDRISGEHLDTTFHQEEVRQLLLGRTVTSVCGESLHLDDGTVLRLRPNEGCGACHSGNYEVNELNACPTNAIFAVEFETEDGRHHSGDPLDTYRVFVLAHDERIKLWEVEGSAGNGCYGSGYWIDVIR